MGKDSADNMAGDTTVKEKDSRALDCLAEREGFEPPIPVKVWPLSRRLVSTTHAPLRAVKNHGCVFILSGSPYKQAPVRLKHDHWTQ